MKRILLATAGVAVVAVVAADDRLRPAGATTGPRQRRLTRGAAAEAARRHQRAEALHRRRQVRRAAVRLHRRPGQERRLRRRDRKVVRPLRVRPRAARLVRVRADRGARAAADDRPRRPRHLDVHLHGRPRHAHRLLAGLLQGDGPAARQERRPVQRSTTSRQRGGDDERLGLRPLDEALLHDTEVVVTDSFTNAMIAFNQGRADAVMFDDAVLVAVAAADPTRR